VGDGDMQLDRRMIVWARAACQAACDVYLFPTSLTVATQRQQKVLAELEAEAVAFRVNTGGGVYAGLHHTR